MRSTCGETIEFPRGRRRRRLEYLLDRHQRGHRTRLADEQMAGQLLVVRRRPFTSVAEDQSFSRNERNLSERFVDTKYDPNAENVSQRVCLLPEGVVSAGRVGVVLSTRRNEMLLVCRTVTVTLSSIVLRRRAKRSSPSRTSDAKAEAFSSPRIRRRTSNRKCDEQPARCSFVH